MPGIEFLGDPSGRLDDGNEELLDTGPGRRLPTWWPAVALAVALALVLGAVVVTQHRGRPPAPRPSASGTAPAPGTPAARVDAALADDDNGDVYLLRDDRIFAQAPDGTQLASTRSLDLGGDPARTRLVLEPVHNTLWVVPQGIGFDGNDAPGVLEAFAGYDLHQVFRAALPLAVAGAAPLHGSLYLAAPDALLSASLGRDRVTVAARLSSLVVGLVADPVRDRLIYVEDDGPPVLRFGDPLPRGAAVPLPQPQVDIAVVGAVVWAAGLSTRGPVLYRFDAALHAGPDLAGVDHLGDRVDIVGTGQRSLFLDVVTGAQQRVWCLDGTTGRVLQRFPRLVGRFVSVGGRSFDTTTGTLRALPAGACQG